MNCFTVAVSLVLAGYGFCEAGLWGAATGYLSVIAAGCGLEMLLNVKDFEGDAPDAAISGWNRSGGLFIAMFCVTSVHFHGWKYGSVWCIGCYAITSAAVAIIAVTHCWLRDSLSAKRHGGSTVALLDLPDRPANYWDSYGSDNIMIGHDNPDM